jgi:glyoxylase-like metal-dependent hydrolase (beta-lactamase superfamily II)
MTGNGTNTYLLGQSEVIVIDPGPAIPAHIEAILRQAQGPIRWILATHTHLDHSPAARELAARSGAMIGGSPPPAGGRQDHTFAPDRVLADGDTIETADIILRAVHTPGHASNHLCYWQPESRALFTGDHLIDGSTVVIDPPDGDMADYLRSLRKISSLNSACLMPGHGEMLPEPRAAIERLLAHRLRREAKVLDALHQKRSAGIDELVAAVYDDVEPRLHAVAARSLLAHLLKLECEGRASRDAGHWRRS